MSERGSPSDHNGTDKTNTDAGAPVVVDGAAPVSGDANLSADAPSASGDQVANKDAKKPEPTLADVMKSAVENTDDASGNSTAPAKTDPEAKVDDGKPAAEKTAEQLAEEDKKLPFHTHPRWKEVTAKNTQLSERVATLEPAAEQFNTIKTFMDTNHLSHEEVGEGFVIMAMAKAGDVRVLQRLDDFRNKVALAIGEKLPDDIQAQVESGAITEDAGKELSRARAKLKVTDADAARRTEADENTKKETAARDLATSCQAATDGWAVEARKTDPDFAKKESAIARYTRALMQEEGFPKTATVAVALAKKAYAQVNADFAAAIPQKEPSRHVQSAPSSHGAKEKPKSLADAVSQAVG